MFKITMSVFSLFVLLFGLSLQASQQIPVKVLSASFNSQTNNVEVLVNHQSGGCNVESYSLDLRGCTDFFAPYTCFADLKGYTDQACGKDTFLVVPFSIEKLGLSSMKFKNSKLIINGTDSDKSQKQVVLRR